MGMIEAARQEQTTIEDILVRIGQLNEMLRKLQGLAAAIDDGAHRRAPRMVGTQRRVVTRVRRGPG
ncbi:hypothetical protein [Bradyrhizobium sp. USDA 10063]